LLRVLSRASHWLRARPRSAGARRIVLALLVLEVAASLQFAFGWGQPELMALTGLNDKILHAAAFLVGAVLASLLWRPLPVLIGVLVFAIAIEVVQAVTPWREGDVDDALASLAGGVLAIVLMHLRDIWARATP
jgi:VanZ family protein